MKQTIIVFCAFLLALFCIGCGRVNVPPEQPQEPVTADEEEPSASFESEAMPAEEDIRVPVLIVYFSATGTTRGVAEKIASLTGGELAEIVPAQPYTEEDLNYNDSDARTSLEQNTPEARPEIAGDISLEGYTTVYLGYPVWWGQAPRILSTFVEKHDFTGITVIPFCTSGSSDIGQSDDTLAAQAGSGNWLQGRRFPGNVPEDDLKRWIGETDETDLGKTLRFFINDVEVPVEWEENESVEALRDLASGEPLAVTMSMYGGFEQVGHLGTSLPVKDVQTTTQAGDIVLYSGNQIVVFFGSNSWAYTRLGRIAQTSAEDMTDLLANGEVVITLSLE